MPTRTLGSLHARSHMVGYTSAVYTEALLASTQHPPPPPPSTPSKVIEFPRGNNNVEGCNSLVEDVPLGARMLAAMANANRAGGR